MLHALQSLTGWAGSRKGAKIVLAVWLIVIVLLSGIAPAAKKEAVSAGEGSIRGDTSSAIASQLLDKHFPSDDGLPALIVFHREAGIGEAERAVISEMSRWLSSPQKPEHAGSALPFHELPRPVQDSLMSDNRTTLLYHLSMKKETDSAGTYETILQIRDWLDANGSTGLQVEITGPAGIASDTLALFKNADLVLLFATIGLILVLLVVIYRSPLLALIPLVIAGLVYQVVDRTIGFAGKMDWFVIDSQALSIMLILLFAVLTDYCLFVFSRYREELRKLGSQYDAMRVTMSQVGEPILFSGGTVLIAMLTLFAAVFKPYHNFAPVFSIAMVVILLAGLTLIPAVFALVGRKAFWPFVPVLEPERPVKRKDGLWSKTGSLVVKRPAVIASALLIVLTALSFNVTTVKYSFNLLKSFPEELSSRQGFELLEQNFPKGKLAPVTVLLTSEKEMAVDEPFLQHIQKLGAAIQNVGHIDSVTPAIVPGMGTRDAPLPRNFVADDRHAIKLQLTLADNPYDPAALDTVSALRQSSADLLRSSGLDASSHELHFAGQTAEQLDVSIMNRRDTVVTFALIAVLITMMLMFQTRSLLAPVIMMATILISYLATLGLGWFVFHTLLGYEAISYRIPVYTFVFLVALGVDYNIMLVSRIREEATKHPWNVAVQRGVSLTGSVISSAGIILAATFAVLTTQPMQELFLFGFTMAIGILLDTFLVRGVLLPSILTLVGGKSGSRKAGPSSAVGNPRTPAG